MIDYNKSYPLPSISETYNGYNFGIDEINGRRIAVCWKDWSAEKGVTSNMFLDELSLQNEIKDELISICERAITNFKNNKQVVKKIK